LTDISIVSEGANNMMAYGSLHQYPVAVLGAGPIGLAAASHLIERGLPVRAYEAGPSVGANIRTWAHVRTFSPWSCNLDSAALGILERHGWQHPRPDYIPTGGELVRQYLEPLAGTPELAGVIETRTTVIAVSRRGMDKITSKGREARPFEIVVEGPDGSRRRVHARAVIDASGTWTCQNPLGANGHPAEGELEHAAYLSYGIPDVLGIDRPAFADKRIIVVGAGYSAANVLLDLAALSETHPRTSITWVIRGTSLARVFGGGLADQLPARGELGADVKDLIDAGKVRLVTAFCTTAVRKARRGVLLQGETEVGIEELGPADRIVVATGQRPDLGITRELRLELDPWLESAKALGPLIDPNVHSCGSVPPHGYRELSHPEPGFYTVGVKSYGRAPTFLLMTGNEQVRSVVAAIAGDMVAADAVQLVLPQTGVCEARSNKVPKPVAVSIGCCGGPAPAGTDACCVKDVEAKAAGEAGCGCGTQPRRP
jgi:thioredoxin reductase